MRRRSRGCRLRLLVCVEQRRREHGCTTARWPRRRAVGRRSRHRRLRAEARPLLRPWRRPSLCSRCLCSRSRGSRCRGTARHARRGRPCGRQQSAGADGDIAPHHRRRHTSGGGRLDGGDRGTGGDRCDVLDRRRNRQDGRCGGAGDGRRGSACRSSHGRRRRANRHRRDAGGLEHGLAPAREAVITRREFRAAAASRALRLEWGHEHTGATWLRRGRSIRMSCKPRSPVGLVNPPAKTQMRRTISHSLPKSS